MGDCAGTSSLWKTTVEFVAGFIGGAVGTAAGQPLDTIRVRIQVNPTLSFMEANRNLVRHEGFAGYLKGMASPIYACAFQNAITFVAYNSATVQARRLLGGGQIEQEHSAADASTRREAPLPLSAVFLSGLVAGLANTLIIVPIDLLKVQLQLQTTISHSLWGGPFTLGAQIVRKEGLLGLYRGFTVTCFRDVPSYGVYFWMYECCRELFQPGCRKDDSDGPDMVFAAGGVAGVISWASIYPIDVMKSRIQGNPGKYSSMLHCGRSLIKEEGVSVFFKAISPTLARAFIVNSFVFLGYEYTIRLAKGSSLY